MVRDALRDRGAPTWRDLDDLAYEPIEDEVVSILRDSGTAGAVMLISPKIAESSMIRNVEAHHIFRRHRAETDFLIKPVLINLDYEEANTILDAPAEFQNLADWNLWRLSGDRLSDSDANAIAISVVKSRLALIAESEQSMPLNIGLFSRRNSGPGPYDLRHDFSPYFNGRVPCDVAVYRRIESALLDTANALSSTHDRTSLLGRGNATLPLGVMYGAIFSPLAGFGVSWIQKLDGQESIWSISSGQGNLFLNTEIIKGDPGSEDIVFAMSISADIRAAVSAFMNSSGLRPRASVHALLETGPVPQGTTLSPPDGLSIVLQAVETVRSLRDDLGLSRARLHLFLACPLAMAVLLGQKLNTFSECVLYEHCADQEPSYLRVHAFNPSNLYYSR